MPILVTVTSLVGPDLRPVVWALRHDGWATFPGPVQMRFVHPDISTRAQAARRLRTIGLDPYLFIIADHPEDEWGDEPADAVHHAPAEEEEARAGSAWTPEEDALLAVATGPEVARLTGRTVKAVERRRAFLRRRGGGPAAGAAPAGKQPGGDGAASLLRPREPFHPSGPVPRLATLPEDGAEDGCGRTLAAVQPKRIRPSIPVERRRTGSQ
jgi:hypothetical protein